MTDHAVLRVNEAGIAALFGLKAVGPARLTPSDIVIPVIDARGEAAGELVGVVTRHEDGRVSLSWRPA